MEKERCIGREERKGGRITYRERKSNRRRDREIDK